MKEEYLEGRGITEEVDKIRKRTPPQRNILNPEKSALLIIDMQRFFTCPDSPAFVPSSRYTLRRVIELYDAFRKIESQVVFTKHYDREENGSMGRIFRHTLKKSSPFFSFDREVESKGPVIEKTTYDAFYETDLLSRLQKTGTEQIVICGLMAERCVETTARSAFVRGFDVFVAADASASFTRKVHLASLISLSSGVANLKKTEEITDGI